MAFNLIVTGIHATISVINDKYIFNDKEYRGAKFSIRIPKIHRPICGCLLCIRT